MSDNTREDAAEALGVGLDLSPEEIRASQLRDIARAERDAARTSSIPIAELPHAVAMAQMIVAGELDNDRNEIEEYFNANVGLDGAPRVAAAALVIASALRT